jgi:kynurenine formamidase
MKVTGKAYDISVVLGRESIDYPEDTPYSRELTLSLEGGDLCDLSRLVMSAHSGTHLDAPAHFIRAARTVDQLEVTDCVDVDIHLAEDGGPLGCARRAEAPRLTRERHQ